ncbi:MAG: NAD-dependent epimerase/dehydratase family protein [Deltaproteobacteria bacterium]|nr:MAG: NAD-dependent epimerase/dehydratase family protein [Deltaproteobacteria bacterium]
MRGCIVVTGASGHVGANLVRRLVAEGVRVRAVVRSNPGPVADTGAEIVRADVGDLAALRAAFQGADAVCHLASLISILGDRGGEVFRVNVDGARNVAVACADAGVGRLVHISSIHAYRHDAAATIDETTPKVEGEGHAAYDLSKAEGERAIRRVAAERDLDVVVVQPTGIVGPFDFGPSRMGRTVLAVARRRLPAVVPGGFDWVDVRDVAEGILLALRRGRSGEEYILSGAYRPIRELVRTTAELAGVRPPPLLPFWTARLAAPVAERVGTALRREPLITRESLATLRTGRPVSSAKARRELGYAPRPPEKAIEDALRWFVDRGMLEPRHRSVHVATP